MRYTKEDVDNMLATRMRMIRDSALERGSEELRRLEEIVAEHGIPFGLDDVTLREEKAAWHEFVLSKTASEAQGGADWDLLEAGPLMTQAEAEATLLAAFGEDGEDNHNSGPYAGDDDLAAEKKWKAYEKGLRKAISEVEAYRAASNAFTKEKAMRQEVVGAIGPVATFALFSTDESIESIKIQAWEGASRFRETVGLVDRYAKAIIENLGVDSPKFRADVLQAQGEYYIRNNNNMVDVTNEIIGEMTTDSHNTLVREKTVTLEKIAKNKEQLQKSVARLTADLFEPVAGLNRVDAGYGMDESSLPGITSLRTIREQHKQKQLASEQAFRLALDAAMAVYTIEAAVDFSVVGPYGVVHDLTGEAPGLKPLQAAIAKFHKLGDESVDPTDPNTIDDDNSPEDGGPSGPTNS